MALSTIPTAGLSSDQGVNFRNLIINGDMSIDQRNSGASQTIASANTYYIDRFLAREVTDGALTIDQDTTAPDDFTHSMKITTTTADSSLSSTQRAYVVQKIEGYNISKLAFGTSSAKSITISFYVRSSLTGTFSGSILNEGENRSYVFEYTINSADTWERKTITIAGDTSGTWDTDNTVGMLIYFSMGMGSTYSGSAGAWSGNQLFASTGSTNLIGTLNATWYMTGLQIEEGTTASDFEFLPYDVNLDRCFRYFQAHGFTTNSGSAIVPYAFAANSTEVFAQLSLIKEMRASPSITQKNNLFWRSNTGSQQMGSISSSGGNEKGVHFAYDSLSVTAGAVGYLRDNAGAGNVGLHIDAEL